MLFQYKFVILIYIFLSHEILIWKSIVEEPSYIRFIKLLLKE